MFGSQPTKLKFKKRDAYYSNSTGTCEYYPESETAYSYSWWRFVERINGELIFNYYSYSSQTTQHQAAVAELLKTMGKTYRLVDAPRGLNCLTESWEHYFRKACELEIEMSKERSQFEKNLKRLSSENSWQLCFNECQFRMAELESVGAKPLSAKRQKEIRDSYLESERCRLEYLAEKKRVLKESINQDLSEVLNKGA